MVDGPFWNEIVPFRSTAVCGLGGTIKWEGIFAGFLALAHQNPPNHTGTHQNPPVLEKGLGGGFWWGLVEWRSNCTIFAPSSWCRGGRPKATQRRPSLKESAFAVALVRGISR